MRYVGHTKFFQKMRFKGLLSKSLRIVSQLGGKFIFPNFLERTKISTILRFSAYIDVVLLINFPDQFEFWFHFKYSRSYKIL